MSEKKENSQQSGKTPSSIPTPRPTPQRPVEKRERSDSNQKVTNGTGPREKKG